MKFLIAKKDEIKCCGCPGTIQRGEEMVVTFVNTPGFKRTLIYHVACYIPWYTDMFNRKWAYWHHNAGNIERPKRGRPVTVITPTQAQERNKLLTLLNYHTHLGHVGKMADIQKRLDKLVQ